MSHCVLVCKEYDLDISFDNYFAHIGRPFKEILEILGIKKNQKNIEITFNEESTKLIHFISLYDDVKKLLKYLNDKKIKTGIVTSKNSNKTKKTLDLFDLSFNIVQSPNETLRGKPCPDHILYAMSNLNIKASETIYIGDMRVDFEAAKSAKVDYVHANWGYGECDSKNIIKLNNIYQLKDFV